MPDLLLVRHGQSTWNALGRWQGIADPPLSPLGEAQAADAIGHLRDTGVRAVVCSDLQRARRTAEIVADGLALAPPTIVGDLRERDVGPWSGRTRAEIAERWPEVGEAWARGEPVAPDGESDEHFIGRVTAAVLEVAALGLAERVLAVTHGGVITWLAIALGAERVTCENLGGRWFHVDGGRIAPGAAVASFVPEATSVAETL